MGWLREFVEVTVLVEELAHRLDMSGTKVEAIHHPGADIEGIVVAEVTSIEPHRNADNLSMVEVTTGGSDVHRVVCGAKDFAVGDRVPLAMVGAKVPGLTITERTIRGEISRGMLCSAAELGVAKDQSGILVLQPGAELGADVISELGLGDPVLELEITPNRPDCMGIFGIAREVAALLGSELRRPPAELETASAIDNPIKVEVQDPLGCPRYLASYLEGVTVGPSPGWIAARLLAAGFRPISNVVDVTNYVLLETGQPLHAFDAAKITDSSLVVRRAERGEVLVTLDGAERTLQPEDLVIADTARALAIAGVMGGLESEVTGSTTAVVLEAAVFDRASVSFTSRRHSLRSEASARFERGTDVEGLVYAVSRAALLMQQIAGSELSGNIAESAPAIFERPVIKLRPRRTGLLLGVAIPSVRQAQHLRAIGLGVEETGDTLQVEIPGFRPDLGREADLIEEIARLEGFGAIPATLPTGPSGGLDASQKAERTLRRSLAIQGLSEAWTSSFMSPADLDALGLPDEHPSRNLVILSNPMLEQEPALRTTLLPGLLGSLRRNVMSHRARSVALFEVARVYSPADELASEELGLAAVFTGHRSPSSWMGEAAEWDLFQVKDVLEGALGSIGVTGAGYRPFEGAPFHPTRAAHILLGDQLLGLFGELHPDVCARFDIPDGSLALEVGLGPLLGSLPGRAKATILPRFPGAYIDIAVVVDAKLPAEQIEDLIKRAGAPEVVGVALFDVYRGEQVPDGKKSLAYSLELSDPQATLTDERIGAVQSRIIGSLAERMGAELRT